MINLEEYVENLVILRILSIVGKFVLSLCVVLVWLDGFLTFRPDRGDCSASPLGIFNIRDRPRLYLLCNKLGEDPDPVLVTWTT